jgi:hypothetical protein
MPFAFLIYDTLPSCQARFFVPNAAMAYASYLGQGYGGPGLKFIFITSGNNDIIDLENHAAQLRS